MVSDYHILAWGTDAHTHTQLHAGKNGEKSSGDAVKSIYTIMMQQLLHPTLHAQINRLEMVTLW